MNRRLRSLETRRTVTEAGCWEWTGYRNRGGYGTYRTPTKNWLVHRLAYTELVGDIPEGGFIHHDCENPACYNPEHLRLMFPGDHSRHHMAGVPKTYQGRGGRPRKYDVCPGGGQI